MPRLARYAPALVLLAAACSHPDTVVSLPGSGDATVARGAVAAVERLWPGAIAQAPTVACAGPEGTPAVLAGDFNGDGASDVIIWTVVGDEARLAAVFTRVGGEYLAVPVEDDDLRPSGVVLVAPRGTTFQLASLTVDSYYGLDTVVTRPCDGPSTAWFWTGSRFDAQPLAN